MAKHLCPLVGTLDDAGSPGPPVDFPSFENRCLVSDERDTLLLADQATYCLSGQHRLCPRFRAAEAMAQTGQVDARTAADLTSGMLASDQLRPELMAMAAEDAGARRRWAWVGAGVMFVTIALCGATFAVWSGWQQVQGFLTERSVGTVQSLTGSSVAQAAEPQYIIMTATPVQLALAPGAVGPLQPNVETGAMQPPAGANTAALPDPQYPAAVTPTPGVAPPGGTSPPAGAPPQEGDPPLIVVEPGALPSLPATDPSAATPSSPPNLLLEVPTRRPTPVFDIPTSTPAIEAPTATPTLTPTPTPMGTPVVVFAPAQQLVPDGDCTIISWAVQNVREVYYENIGVDGRGQREECVDDVLEVYRLVVILPDGSSRTYTTTVTMLMPTETSTPTPTFTPEPVLTPTWTPMPPTATPTPAVSFGVSAANAGPGEVECAAGATCDLSFVVVNSGNGVDTLRMALVEQGPWSALICRADGVCAAANLEVANVAPGNSVFVSVRIAVPNGATGSGNYGLQATSAGSGGVTVSNVARASIRVR
jgi:hypothetical protein